MDTTKHTYATDGGEDRPTHRVVGKEYRWGDEVYQPGDTLTPPDHAVEHHGARFEAIEYGDEPRPVVDESGTEDEVVGEDDEGGDDDGIGDDNIDEGEDVDVTVDADAEADDPEMPFDPGDYSVASGDLADKLAEVDDKETLYAIRSAESNGANRTTAKQAVDDRLGDIEENGGESNDTVMG